MKKLLAVVLTIILIVTGVTPSFAMKSNVKVERAVPTEGLDNDMSKKAKVSKDEAINIAKTKLEDIFDYDINEKEFDMRVEFREDYGSPGEYVWSISWDHYYDERSININARIEGDTGELRSLRKREYNHNEDRPTIAKITREEAKEIANTFIKRVNPKEYKEVQLMDDEYPNYIYGGYGGTNYYFTYNRLINNIKFDSNNIGIQVDGINEEVISYEYRWDKNIDVPSVKGVIDKEKAQKIMADNIDMSLSYISHRNKHDYDSKVKGVKLVYNPDFSKGYLLDAKKEEMINPMERNMSEEKVKDISKERKEEIASKAKKSEKLSKEISQDKATNLIKNYIKEIYGEGYNIRNTRYTEDEDYYESNGEKAWSARFEKEENTMMGSGEGGDITINAMTGELISANKYFYNDNWEKEFEPAITWEKAYDKAIDVVEEYFPSKINDIDTELKYIERTRFVNGKELPPREFYFDFGRVVNGINHRDNSIGVSIDTETGNITDIRYRWDENVEFPGKDGIISEEDAEDIYFEEYEPELVYNKINKNGDYKNPEWETKLVYRLRPIKYRVGNIDAVTGKMLDYSGEEIEKVDNNFKDKIKGHPDEKKLSILATQGIINSEKIELDKEVTLEEAIKMLVDAKGYRPYLAREAEELKFSNVSKDDDNYKYLQLAIRYGILDNEEVDFKADDKITREELSKMMVKLLEYDKLAELKDIFRLPIKDDENVSEDKIGYVAISLGLGIMKEDNGEFRPKDNVKMVEMAVIVYEALANLENN